MHNERSSFYYREEDADEENDDTHRPSIVEELWDYLYVILIFYFIFSHQ